MDRIIIKENIKILYPVYPCQAFFKSEILSEPLESILLKVPAVYRPENFYFFFLAKVQG